jgi:hypothetical protein
LPQENGADLNPVKVQLFIKLSLNRSNGWVVLELAPENRSDVAVWAEDGTIALNNVEEDKRTLS